MGKRPRWVVPALVTSVLLSVTLVAVPACGRGSGSLGEPVTVAVGEYPRRVAVAPDGKRVYVTYRAGIAVVDAGTNSVLGTIGLGNSTPDQIVITPDGRRAYLADSQEIETVDLTTNLVGDPIKQRDFVGDLTVTRDARNLFLLTQSGGLEALELATGTPRTIAPFAYSTPAMVATADGARVYLVSGDSIEDSPVRVVDTGTGAVTAVPDSSSASAMALTADQRHLYTLRFQAERGSEVVGIDPTSNAIVRTIPLAGFGVADLAVSPDGRRLAALSPTDGVLTLFDLESGSRREQVEVGEYPKALTFSPDGRRLYLVAQGGLVAVDVTD